MSPARWRWVSIAVLAVAVAAIGWALRDAGPAVRQLWQRPGGGWLLGAAVLAAGAGTLLLMGAWRAVLAGVGAPLDLPATVRIFFGALLGARVAGALGSAGASLQLGRSAGVPVRSMLTGYLVNAVVVVLSGAVIGALAAPHLLGADLVLLLAPLAVSAVFLLRPELIIALANRAARLLRREPVATASPAALRLAFLRANCAWLVGSLHLWLIAVVLGAPPAASLPICVGSFALATVAGTVAVVVPDGAGVRELVAMGALATVLPLPHAGLAVLVSRVCCVTGDMLAACGMLLLTRSSYWISDHARSPRPPDQGAP